METFAAAPHHDVLVLLVQIAILLAAARIGGEIAQRLNQPAVVGELLAGIILGPSLLGGFVPAIDRWVIPNPGLQGHLLEVISMLGAMFLLLITGMETDLALIRRHARSAIGASVGGVVVPFATGFLLGMYLPDRLLADPSHRVVFALFVATAMSISAIPVIAKVLMDMNLMRRDVGQTILAAGMTDDAIGWMLLSVVIGIAGGAGVTALGVAAAVGKVLVLILLAFTLGRWLVKKVLNLVQDEMRSSYRMLTLVVVLTFAGGALTQGMGLEAVFGAFLAGILLGQMPRLPESVHHQVTSIALGVFTPIFFAVAGLKVNARALLDPALLGIALVVIAVATFGKVVGGYVGGRYFGGRDPWTSLAFGVGMNARGAMEIIIATIGLELGLLSQDMFSIIVVMAIATSLMAPPALRWTLARVIPEAQELERLRREELAATSFVTRLKRVLLPVRLRPDVDAVHEIKSYLIQRLAGHGTQALTLLNITSPEDRANSAAFLDRIASRFRGVDLSRKVVTATEPGRVILEEAQKHYDLLVLGATERPADGGIATGALFHPLVDEMVRMAPCPTIVVRPGEPPRNWPPKRILVPTNGSRAARNAAELAFALAAAEEDAEVLVLHVIQTNTGAYRIGAAMQNERERENAERAVRALRELGEGYGVRTEPLVQEASEIETAVVDTVTARAIDLVILGTDVRPASERLFLGPRVERMLATLPSPVLVVNTA
jgi:Kef-type K+ transport system membrane component KefB/nucleotide-binding universal stress UspA family protein